MSTDGTQEVLKSLIQNHKIIYKRLEKNIGGAGGFSEGIKYAYNLGYEYFWVMDDDCMPKQDALSKLMAVNNRKLNYGFLASKVLWKDGNICTMNIPRKTPFKKVIDFDSKLVTISMASFVSLLIPRKIVKDVGLPIKDFFIWTDDWEYTRRISQKYPCYLENKSVVVHESASNKGADIASDSISRLKRYQYLYRNDVYLYRREGYRGFIYELARLTDHLLRVLFRANNNRYTRIKIIFKGTFDGIGFHPKIEKVD